MISSLLRTFRDRRSVRRSIKSLRNLSDHQLADLGLSRSSQGFYTHVI